MSKVALVLFKRKEGIFLKTTSEGGANVHAFDNLVEAVRYFEGGYQRGHSRGYESSMSSCMHYISFQPVCVELTNNEVEDLLGDPPWSAFTHSGLAGSMNGLKCTGSCAEEVYNNGIKPKLT